MKITWAEIKENLRIVLGENLQAYESEHELTSEHEFEFKPDAKDIDYYMLSENTIKAVTRAYSLKEMFDMSMTNWDGEKITEINWNEKDNPGPQNEMQLMTMKEYATLWLDDIEEDKEL